MSKIISEVGINWSGDLIVARDMIIQSARAGADYVKFQLFNEETIKDSKYKYELSQMILNEELIQYLSDRAKEYSIGFGISVMFKEGFDILNQLNPNSIQFIKIRFSDRCNDELAECAIVFCKEHKSELIVSCNGFFDSLEVSEKYIKYPTKYLYCVPKYPPELKEINTDNMQDFDGYSNHYPSMFLPMLAVVKELEFIEVHVKRKTRNNLQQLDENVSIDFDDLTTVCEFRDIIQKINGGN